MRMGFVLLALAAALVLFALTRTLRAEAVDLHLAGLLQPVTGSSTVSGVLAPVTQALPLDLSGPGPAPAAAPPVAAPAPPAAPVLNAPVPGGARSVPAWARPAPPASALPLGRAAPAAPA